MENTTLQINKAQEHVSVTKVLVYHALTDSIQGVSGCIKAGLGRPDRRHEHPYNIAALPCDDHSTKFEPIL
jgi:hypothetical protein